jgi:predicted amidohydrolase
MNLIVSAVQIDTSLGDKERNNLRAEQNIRKAAQAGANIIVIPELFNTGYRLDERYSEFAETIPGSTVERMAVLAKSEGVYIAGSITEQDPDSEKLYDTAFLVSPQGLEGRYRKIHLWGREPEFFSKGKEFPVFGTPWGQVGLIICYDVGFPEAARSLALAGADIILIPSAFGMPRFYAWDLATRARALENGCYLVASNRIGNEKDSVFCGHSRIVDPQGSILVDAGLQEGILLATIDMVEVAAQRTRIPYLRDRMPETYRQELNRTIAAPFASQQEAAPSTRMILLEKQG